MPYVLLQTNVELTDEKDLVKKLSKVSSDLIGKPESAFAIQVRHDPALYFAGSFDPAFMLTVHALGGLDGESNDKYSEGYYKFLEDELKIPGTRGYIVYTDPGWDHWAHKGKTFRDRMK